MFGLFKKQNSTNALPNQKINVSNWGANKAPQMAPTDKDGISRVFSNELFQGETGELLRRAGLSPNMPGNIAQTEQTFQTFDARYKSDLKEFIEKFDFVLKGQVKIKPMYLVPEKIWTGAYRNFLCATCNFYVADPTNVMFLAADAFSAEKLGIPIGSDFSDDEISEKVEKIIDIIGKTYLEETQSVEKKTRAAKSAYETARGLGLLVSALRFDVANPVKSKQVQRENELFGSLMWRSKETWQKFITT
jgi:hypothetical protein